MKSVQMLLYVLCFVLFIPTAVEAQKVSIGGTMVVGMPKDGDTLLTFNSERPWMFRQLGTGSGTSLELYSTVGLKQFIITTTGNVGIGVTAPTEKLHVDGNIKAGGSKISFGSSEYIQDDGSFLIGCNGTLRSVLDNTDNLGSSSRRWNTVWASNGTISTSDISTKTNVREIGYGLNDIMQLHPVSFEWIDRPDNGSKLGLIAQEVQQVIREVVVDHETVRDENTGKLQQVPSQKLGMYYADLIPVLIKGMQEQQQLINDKQSHITELELKMSQLEARLARLEKQLLTPVQ